MRASAHQLPSWMLYNYPRKTYSPLPNPPSQLGANRSWNLPDFGWDFQADFLSFDRYGQLPYSKTKCWETRYSELFRQSRTVGHKELWPSDALSNFGRVTNREGFKERLFLTHPFLRFLKNSWIWGWVRKGERGISFGGRENGSLTHLYSYT